MKIKRIINEVRKLTFKRLHNIHKSKIKNVPKNDHWVWYYFKITGLGYGYCTKNGFEFGGVLGFLNGDVTHWAYAPKCPVPVEGMEDLVEIEDKSLIKGRWIKNPKPQDLMIDDQLGLAQITNKRFVIINGELMGVKVDWKNNRVIEICLPELKAHSIDSIQYLLAFN